MPQFNPCNPCCEPPTTTCTDFSCPTCNYVVVYVFNFETAEWLTYGATGYILKYNNDITITTINPGPTVDSPYKHFYVIGNLASHCALAKNALIADFGADNVTEIVTTDLENLTDCYSQISLVPEDNGEDFYYAPFFMILKYCGNTCCYSLRPSTLPFQDPTRYPPGCGSNSPNCYFDVGLSASGYLAEYGDEYVVCHGIPLHYYYPFANPETPPYNMGCSLGVADCLSTPCAVCSCCSLYYALGGQDCSNCPVTVEDVFIDYAGGFGCGFPYCISSQPLVFDYVFDWCDYGEGVQETFPITSGFMTISSAAGTFERRTVPTTASIDFCEDECVAFIARHRPAVTYSTTATVGNFPDGTYGAYVIFTLPSGHEIEIGDVLQFEVDDSFATHYSFAATYTDPGSLILNGTIHWHFNSANEILLYQSAPVGPWTVFALYFGLPDTGTIHRDELWQSPAGPVTITFDEPVCAVAFGVSGDLFGVNNTFSLTVNGTGGFSGSPAPNNMDADPYTITTGGFSGFCGGNFFEIRSNCPDQKINSITFGFGDLSPIFLTQIWICAGF